MTEKMFRELLAQYLDGDLTTEELLDFKKAVEETPLYRHLFQDEIRIHTLLKEVVTEKIDEKKISSFHKSPVVASNQKKNSKPLSFIYSAVAAILIIGGILSFVYIKFKPESVAVCVQAPNDGTFEVLRSDKIMTLHKDMELWQGDVVLTDDSEGTLLLLNDGSMLSIGKNSRVSLFENSKQQVSLAKGDVVVEVTKRKHGELPFKVKTPDANLAVLGTVFSVNVDLKQLTTLNVYDGKVELERLNDLKKVTVSANYSAKTADRELQLSMIDDDTQEKKHLETINIQAVEDVYFEGRDVQNSKLLKVRGQERSIYLKFSIRDVGPVSKAVLFMKQEIDPGSGTLSFYMGDRTDWTETTINSNNAPRPTKLVAERTGAVSGGKLIQVDVSEGIKGDGDYTLIVTLDKGEAFDIWFSSKEGLNPPILQLSK